MRGSKFRILINEREVQNLDLSSFAENPSAFAEVTRSSGSVGFLARSGRVNDRKITILAAD